MRPTDLHSSGKGGIGKHYDVHTCTEPWSVFIYPMYYERTHLELWHLGARECVFEQVKVGTGYESTRWRCSKCDEYLG